MTAARLAGAAILMCASLFLSLRLTAAKRKRERELYEICDLIRYVRNNIDSFLTPLGSIFSKFSSPALDSCGFVEALENGGLSSAAVSEGISLLSNERRLLLAFSEKLGLGYRDEEIRLCDYYYKEFSEIARREREENDKKSKMYKYLPPLAALSLIIIFI